MNILLVSGGNDSLYIYHKYNKQKHFKLIYIDYGQKYIMDELKRVPWDTEVIKIQPLIIEKNGFVRGRNLNFLIEIAKLYRDATIYMGSNKDDIFPDNNKYYLEKACWVINKSYNTEISVILPLQSRTKPEIMTYIKKHKISSYSCYKGGTPCGKCKACKSVKDATNNS
jgi:7-cyano-7-deazaguanine synthase in queuosine biosynthesis